MAVVLIQCRPPSCFWIARTTAKRIALEEELPHVIQIGLKGRAQAKRSHTEGHDASHNSKPIVWKPWEHAGLGLTAGPDRKRPKHTGTRPGDGSGTGHD